MKYPYILALSLCMILGSLCSSTLKAENEASATQGWKVTAMTGTHMFVDYLGGARVGAAPEMGLRASYWLVNDRGRKETGIGLDYSGLSGRVAGESFSYNRLGINLMWDMLQSTAAAIKDKLGVVPYLHAGVAFAPYGVAVPVGIGGYLEWRLDEHLAVQGELRGSFLSAKKVREVNGNFNVAGNASATIGVSWSF